MSRPRIKLRINSASGEVTAIYSDAALPILSALVVDPKDITRSTRRASHVEPHPDGGWAADLAPVGGPVLLGAGGVPFPTREAALAAEVAWLDDNIISAGIKK